MATDDFVDLLVRATRHEAENVLSLELEHPAGAELPEWQPGAHIDVVVSDGSTRQYSLSGDPAQRRSYRIAVLREAAGRGGSEHLHRGVRAGDTVRVKGPRNHFKLEDAPAYVFIAGGIGITPLLPMLAAADAAGADWQLHYFGGSSEAMAFVGELARHGERARVIPRDARRESALADIVSTAPSDALYYACGPARLTGELAALLESRGEADRMRSELFAAPDSTDQAAGDGFSVRLERSGLELPVAPEQSILEVITAAGIDVLTDCEEGICGSCETTVISGEVDHRDHVLTRQERESNSCMMVCVSRAACPVLVLDL